MKNKSIAIDILEEYASSYSRTDIDRLVARFDEREKAIRKETAEEILKEIMFRIDINYCNRNEMLILNLCEMLAKQFGVEIKE